MPSSTNNELILIGGYQGNAVTEYLASKAQGEIGIVTFARDDRPADYINQYLSDKSDLFGEFDCKVRHVRSADDLEGLSLILYVGGNQNKLASKLRETGLHLALLNAWRKGEVILAGSSAGAMVMCGVMLEEDSDETDDPSILLTYGMGPLGACFVVPHWAERTTEDWQSRLLDEHGEGYYIFGIDENTAMVWRAGKCKVIGVGQVHARGRMTGDWSNGQEFEIARGW